MDSMEDTAPPTDEVSMMERPGRSRRRRHRPRSRSAPRGRGTGSLGARVTEEVRHLGGGRASGSGSDAGHLGDRPLPLPKRRPDSDRVTACPKRTHRRAGRDGTRREVTAEPASGSGGPSRASGSEGSRRDEVRIGWAPGPGGALYGGPGGRHLEVPSLRSQQLRSRAGQDSGNMASAGHLDECLCPLRSHVGV